MKILHTIVSLRNTRKAYTHIHDILAQWLDRSLDGDDLWVVGYLLIKDSPPRGLLDSQPRTPRGTPSKGKKMVYTYTSFVQWLGVFCDGTADLCALFQRGRR